VAAICRSQAHIIIIIIIIIIKGLFLATEPAVMTIITGVAMAMVLIK